MKKYTFGLSIVSFAGGCIINFSGQYSNGLIMILLLLLVVETISFLSTGIIKESLTWKFFLKEMLKHVLLATIIIISYMLDFILGAEDRFKNSTLLFYVGIEMTNIIRHAISVGIPLPEIIIKLIEQIESGKTNGESDVKIEQQSDEEKKI